MSSILPAKEVTALWLRSRTFTLGRDTLATWVIRPQLARLRYTSLTLAASCLNDIPLSRPFR